MVGVRSGEVTEPTLAAKLQQHVEQIDVDMVKGLAGLGCWGHSTPLRSCCTAPRRVCTASFGCAHHPSTTQCLPCCPAFPQALEYQLQQGVTEAAKVEACLMPHSARHQYGPEAHCDVGVIRRLQEL